jgi:ubiquinone/menaquinone biosynthesis C-methylase UbiE
MRRYPLFLIVVLACGGHFAAAQPAATVDPASVKPGINDRFLDPKLDPDEWAKNFEVESREVFAAREAVLKATGIDPGDHVADIGAGTGLYTALFSSHVGDDGWVYAVDISPRFIEHIATRAAKVGLDNVSPVLCGEKSANLPPRSIDAAFICDTYHHFEYPPQTLASIYQAIKPGGTLVVVDFERIEGESSDWTLGHVRAGKEVFRQEIESAGFEFVDEPRVEGLKDNYLLRFRRPVAGAATTTDES